MIINAEDRFAKRRADIKTAANFEKALKEMDITLEEEGTMYALHKLTHEFMAKCTLFPEDK